jgi:hypothetical protein
MISRHTPYPPSLSRMAASTILPAIGASTWAFGSHKCVKNIGNFTKNPLIRRIFKLFGIIISYDINARVVEFGE